MVILRMKRSNKKNQEKADYGWYVKNLIFGLLIVGLIGFAILIVSLFLQRPFNIIIFISGICLLVLFMWPAIGISALNIIIGNKFFLDKRLKILRTINNPKILDVGCGTGRTAINLAKILKKGGIVYGIDIYDKQAISGNRLETIQRNAIIENVKNITSFQYGSATEIPFENEIFDIITISSVLHEIHDIRGQEKALYEIYRVLKQDGYLYLSEWNRTSWQTIFYFGIFSFVFQKYNYWIELLKKSGFKDSKYENIGGFGIFTARK